MLTLKLEMQEQLAFAELCQCIGGCCREPGKDFLQLCRTIVT